MIAGNLTKGMRAREVDSDGRTIAKSLFQVQADPVSCSLHADRVHIATSRGDWCIPASATVAIDNA